MKFLVDFIKATGMFCEALYTAKIRKKVQFCEALYAAKIKEKIEFCETV
jgi:hypothetical protein